MNKFKRFFALMLGGLMLFSMPLTVSADETEAPAVNEESVDLNGTYHARLGMQGQTEDGKTWIWRIGYYNKPDGDGISSDTDGVSCQSEFTDAVIEGNGTYTVSMKSPDLAGISQLNQLHVATDIANTGDITFSDLIVKINGVERTTYKEVYVDDDTKTCGNLCVLLAYNLWRSTLMENPALMDNSLMSGETEISLTFTVSGFAYDKAPEETTPAETTPEETTAEKATTAADPVKKSSATPIIIGVAVAAAIVIGIFVGINVSKKKKN